MASQDTGFYKTFWLEEGRVAYVEFIGAFSEDLITEMNMYVRDEFIERGQAPIHLIVDATGLTDFPRNVRVLKNSTQFSVDNAKVGWVILIGFENPLIKFVSSVIAQMFHLRFKQVKTFEDATDLLQRVDLSLKKIS